MSLIVRTLGQQPYLDTWEAMRTFTDERTADTPDELWLLEHEPVFTQGQAGKPEHVLAPGDIPVIQTDRGGQVTYHGPGQLIAYPLIDLRRRGLSIRDVVTALEESVIALLKEYNIDAVSRCDAPGVYIDGAKIASIGLRVRKGYTYHGLSFNVDMDLSPFSRINPCGYENLPVTQLRDYQTNLDRPQLAMRLAQHLQKNLGSQLRKK